MPEITFDWAGPGLDFSCYTISRRRLNGDIEILEQGALVSRIVRSAQRKRKLRRRGESVGWDASLGAWTWNMRRPYPTSGDGS